MFVSALSRDVRSAPMRDVSFRADARCSFRARLRRALKLDAP
jgi:hypothetical protein